MKKYKDFGVYDFSDYAEEITGDAVFKINGGGKVENSHEGVAGAKPGDTITRKNGDVIVLKQADIDYANAQLGNNGNDGTGNTNGNSGTGNNSNSGSNNTSNSRSTNNSSSGANNTGISNTSTSESTPEVSEEIKQNSDAYANYMSLQGRAKDEGEPDRYKGYNVLGCRKMNLSIVSIIENHIEVQKTISEGNTYVTQDIVGKDLGLPENKTCLLTDWINVYISEGMTYQQCISVVNKEIEKGNIRKEDAYLEDQLAVSKALAKELKKQDFDGKYLQYPWKNGIQVQFSNQKDFSESNYDYAIGQFSSTLSNEYHYELFYKDEKYDPYPNGVESCSNWVVNSLDCIKPLGWYK